MNRTIKILAAVAILLFLVGVGFLCFPPVSNCVGKNQAENIAKTYDENKDKIAGSAIVNNRKITSAQQLSDKEREEYYSSGTAVLFKKDIKQLKIDSEKYNKKLTI